MDYSKINETYKLDNDFDDFIKSCEVKIRKKFDHLEDLAEFNQMKVLRAFKSNNLETIDFNSGTGYGYSDTGSDKIEAIFADIFDTEAALVRPSIVSGTHALSIVLYALLNKGDKILSITDDPYDTMQQVIGIAGDKAGNLKERGILYDKIPLDSNSQISHDKIKEKLTDDTKICLIQRSTGYTQRRAFSIDEIKRAIDEIKAVNPNTIVFVDNCYGEFTEEIEPSQVGADIIAGSLIKNLGGGIAITGGYICGRQKLIDYCANTLTAPGIGKDEGLSFGTSRLVAEGLYFAPHIVKEAMKVALLFASAFEELGYNTIPRLDDIRSDIVQAIELKDGEKIKVFCKAIQEACSVDSNFIPESYPMPGYEDPVIMAAGGFVEGATSELSADGPIREPYTVYLQGGLNYYHGKLALKVVLDRFKKNNFI